MHDLPPCMALVVCRIWLYSVFGYHGYQVGRKEILNTKNNEFNSGAMFSLWSEPAKVFLGQD